MMKKILLLVLTLTSLFNVNSQTFNKPKLDSLFDIIEKNEKGMGSISIFREGNEIYHRSIGYADILNQKRNDENTLFRIGSISKTFTAVIILQMVDEKKLKLDTKLSQFYPAIPNADQITIEQLLRHRTGIHSFTEDSTYLTWCIQPQSHEDILKRIENSRSEFEPGTKHKYSNTNYVLLAYIAEQIDQQDFASVLQKRITLPLQLKYTAVGGKINPGQNQAFSYVKKEKWEPAPETDMSVPSGAGAIVSTPHDLNVFFTALFEGKLVSDSMLVRMKKMVENYGMGLVKFPYYDKKVYGHTGGIDGFQSFAGYFPTEHLCIAYTANGVVMSRNDIILGALNIYFGKEYTLPEFKAPVTLSAEDLVSFPGTYAKEGFPVKLSIIRDNDKLYGQGTGQASFLLTPTGKDTFINEEAGINIKFASGNKLYLKQGPLELEMVKE